MHLFVVSGRAGDHRWPVTVFTSEIQASVFCEIANGMANACEENLKMFQQTTAYQAADLLDKAALNKILVQGISGLDPQAKITAESSPISYYYKKVAICD